MLTIPLLATKAARAIILAVFRFPSSLAISTTGTLSSSTSSRPLSTDIKDALYGFRCYPLEPVRRLYRQVEVGHGMVFDTEIAVRLYWQGVAMINVDTRVDYIAGGVSHFHYVRDNLRIARLHTMLILGMLVRFPRLAFRGRS